MLQLCNDKVLAAYLRDTTVIRGNVIGESDYKILSLAMGVVASAQALQERVQESWELEGGRVRDSVCVRVRVSGCMFECVCVLPACSQNCLTDQLDTMRFSLPCLSLSS